MRQDLPVSGEQAFAIKLMQHLVVPTFVLDASRRVIVWNHALERLTGVSADSVLGTTDHWKAFYDEPRHCLADLVALGLTDQMEKLYVTHVQPCERSNGLKAENWCAMPRLGHRCFLAIDAGPIFDEKGNLLAVVETLRDHTDKQEALMTLERMAHSDGLTGIANRRTFDNTLACEWRRGCREKTPLSLILMDIDHFKKYNDHYGHIEGDACLKRVAKVIAKSVKRPGDLVARYGGEEFVVLLPSTPAEGAKIIAEHIRAGIEAQNILHTASPTSPHVTASLGVVTVVPERVKDASLFVKAADEALYLAKENGRNQVAHT